MGTLRNDFEIDIATAHSRLSKKWKNKRVKWSEFVQKCKQAKQTDESIEEYLKMPREEQSNIKDVGGFVGGYLSGGVRKTANVMWRSVATLDIDYGTPDVWDDFTMQFNFAAVMYSTHKYTREKPRLRLVFPFSRQVKPTEYEPLCRKIANAIGINLFDTTTYELARLFYWPSTSKGSEFICEVQDGPACDVDAILGEYVNYRDVSEWPLSSRENEIITHEARKAGDPLEKPGLIGAFCRTYTIEDAIEKFLPDVYDKTATEGRYTYKLGSVAAGLVCYEHKFAYSNHETDPVSKQLCNAFDLCRVHLFGVHDEGSRITDVTRLPSYLKMQDFVAKDKSVRVLLTKERQAKTNEDFASIHFTDTAESNKNDSWLTKLSRNRKGEIENTNKNRTLIALNDEKLQVIKYDLFKSEFVITDKNSRFKGLQVAGLDDISTAEIAGYVEDAYGLNISAKDIIPKLLYPLATERGFNPVKDFILSEQWDKQPRVETVLIDYLGADDTEINRAVTKKWLTAAVARIFEPGCKIDYILTLQGEQGIGKSLLLMTLAGEWYNGNFSFALSPKERYEIINDAWIVEIGELAGMKKADVESAKAFITNTEDKYRRPYGRVTEHFPRHCVMAATTNEEFYLRSSTDEDRRWWPVKVKGRGSVSEWLNTLKKNIGQIWAEAYENYKNGEPLYLPPELEAEMRQKQKQCNVVSGDALLSPLQEWLDTPLPADWGNWPIGRRVSYFRNRDPLDEDGVIKRDRICIAEVKSEFPHREILKYSSQAIGQLLDRCENWKRSKNTMRIPQYGKPRCWIRKEPHDANEDDI